MTNRAACVVAWVSAMVAWFCAGSAGAQSTQLVTFTGGASYQISTHFAEIRVDGILNPDQVHSTQSLRLELWAMVAPFPGGNEAPVHWKMAQYTLGQLPPGGSVTNIDTGVIAGSFPASGTWYVALLLTQYDGSDINDGYEYFDWIDFPNPLLSGQDQGVEAIVEYYFAASNTYFITGLAGEIQALDSGQFAGWQRTGFQFNGYDPTKAASGTTAVCRFFNDSFGTTSSHFYALHGLGCEDTIADFPDWKLESATAFNMKVPDAGGHCPSDTVPVYRLFNNGMGGTPNHRYTISSEVRDAMISEGWTPEGYGIGVEFCSPI